MLHPQGECSAWGWMRIWPIWLQGSWTPIKGLFLPKSSNYSISFEFKLQLSWDRSDAVTTFDTFLYICSTKYLCIYTHISHIQNIYRRTKEFFVFLPYFSSIWKSPYSHIALFLDDYLSVIILCSLIVPANDEYWLCSHQTVLWC